MGLTLTVEPQPLFFGGSSSGTEPALWTLTLACPLSGEPAEVTFQLPVSGGERILDVQVESVAAAADPGPAPARPVAPGAGGPPADASPSPGGWMHDEVQETRKGSAALLRTFGTTMLSTSTGAVAIHFTVLSFLGLESIGKTWRVLTLLPAIAFLLSAVLFVMTLRPVLAWVGTDEQFGELRRSRLLACGRIASAGIFLFLGGVATAIAAYGALLW
ncbi:hypothetical protein [Pyxidicoccus trucidator]|uniref:hypothetical protein n=1 Tax=Pyxidicoccus trucidator TaxID=2709662 RepID=UPI001966D0C2|nr:hypothetical protein [Pyxidicoccus trucidator]